MMKLIDWFQGYIAFNVNFSKILIILTIITLLLLKNFLLTIFLIFSVLVFYIVFFYLFKSKVSRYGKELTVLGAKK